MKLITVQEVKEYEKQEYLRAFQTGTEMAWKAYYNRVRAVVREYNRTHEEQIDLDAIMD